MSLPEHTGVPDSAAALAPYNFVPLPAQVVLVPQEDIPDQDRYHTNGTDRIDRLSGRIECRLTTASPLYVRAGWQPEDFVAHGEKSFDKLKDEPGQQQKRADFFHHGAPQRPRIPGSSLRGMLRALVEIVGYGKMERVTKRGLVYRAVGDTTSLGERYRDRFLLRRNDGSYQTIVQAGYMQRSGGGWQIMPAQVQDGFTFARIEQTAIPNPAIRTGNKVFVEVDPPRVYTHAKGKVRLFYPKVHKCLATPASGLREGILVRTGRAPNKHMEFVVYPPDPTQTPLVLSQEMINEYREQLSQDQKRLLGNDGVFQANHPVFYLVDQGKVVFFGHAMMFRLPYTFSPRDFVPEHLRHVADTDLADAIFGYVRPGVSVDKARAGRLFVSDAELEGEPQQLWCEPEVITPKILSGPKPTTFQHYLVQESTQKRNLMHYASTPTDETVVRGHKRYWHKPNVPLADMIERDLGKIAKAASQYTRIKPVAPGVSFCFTLRFENLSQIELGALLWVLRLAADERYRLALGMGKPLGMGAVSISSSVYKDDRQARYSRLLDGAQWQTGEQALEQAGLDACLTDFKDYVLKESGEQERGHTELDQPLRMRCLLALLSWKEAPPAEKAGYMELERFRERPVLPRPTQVIGWEPAPTTASASPSQPKRQPATPVAVPMVAPAAAPSEPVVELRKLDLNIVLTGNKKGELRTSFGRGVQVEVNLKGYALPKDTKEVVGFLSRQDAGGSTSGGFRGTLVDVKVDGAILYLILKPVSKG